MKGTELSQLTTDGAGRYFLTCERFLSVWTFTLPDAALRAQAALAALVDWREHDGVDLTDYDFERLVKFLMGSLQGPLTEDQLKSVFGATPYTSPRPIFDVIKGGAASAPVLNRYRCGNCFHTLARPSGEHFICPDCKRRGASIMMGETTERVLGIDWGEPDGDHTAVASLDKFGGVSVEVLKHRGHRGDGFTLADEPALGDPPDNVGRLARWLRPRK